jgi:glucokinase
MKYLAGIDLGGTNIKAVLTDETLNLCAKTSVPTPYQRPAEEVFSAMFGAVERVIAEAGVAASDLAGIGVGVPGLTDSRKNLAYEVKFLRWTNLDVAQPFVQRFGVPAFAENDGAVNALGECRMGAAQGAKNLILLTLGTGLGSGIIVDGELLRGRDGVAAETGHMVIESGGDLCVCGKRGCFESCCSATALIRYARRFVLDNPDSLLLQYAQGDIFAIDGPMIDRGYDAGDKASREAITLFTQKLSVGLVNLIDLFNPDKIVLSGGCAKSGERILGPVRELVRQNLMHPIQQCDIVTGTLGTNAGALGACVLAGKGTGVL